MGRDGLAGQLPAAASRMQTYHGQGSQPATTDGAAINGPIGPDGSVGSKWVGSISWGELDASFRGRVR